MSEGLYGLVLAGGRSQRMGRDKALLTRKGQSQLAYLAKLLGQVTVRAFVSTRTDQSDEPERQRFPQIVDRYANMGPIAGILSALEEYPGKDWLVVACDLPNVDRGTLEYLIEHFSDGQPFTAYRSSHDGLPEPLCAVYRRGSEAIIHRFIGDGVVCPRKILIRSDTRLLEQPDPSALDNVNTPEDLASSILEAAS